MHGLFVDDMMHIYIISSCDELRNEFRKCIQTPDEEVPGKGSGRDGTDNQVTP
jgi:hypothetical protein